MDELEAENARSPDGDLKIYVPRAPAGASARTYVNYKILTEQSFRQSVQLSSDALAAYIEATERAFGADIDYGQVVKLYEAEPVGRGRYGPPHVIGSEHTVMVNIRRANSSRRLDRR